MTFEGKRALITGGSSGIGFALAKLLVAGGADVTLLARHKDGLDRAEGELSHLRQKPEQSVDSISADVGDLAAVTRALQPRLDPGKLPDLVINSAGVAHPGYAQELEPKIFHWMMDVNYFGTVHVTQAFLAAMIQRGSGQIVTISSVAGFLAVFGYTAYGASKFAVRGYSDVLRAELKGTGVDISIVFPPDTQTPQLDYENQFKPAETKALVGDTKPLSADVVASDILKGIARRRYVIIPGFENKLYYWLSGALGTGLYPLMDFMVARARASAQKARP
jgi:3-dehydrosphinganine reductase